MNLSLKQKIVISIIIVVLVVAGGLAVYVAQEKNPTLSPTEQESSSEVVKTVHVGYGWSVKNDIIEAIDDAAFSVRGQLQEYEPDFVIVFFSGEYDPTTVHAKVNNHFPNAQIFGGASDKSIPTYSGIQKGEIGSVALFAVSSQYITFGVGGVDFDDFTLPKEAGKAAVQAAIGASGRSGTPKLIMMYIHPFGYEEDVIEGIGEVVGSDVPVVGGCSGSGYGNIVEFTTDEVHTNGVSLAVVYTDFKVGWKFDNGYLKTEYRGTVTNCTRRTIYEIDGMPAADVYNDWTGGYYDDIIANGGGNILIPSAYYPLAIVVPTGATEGIITIHLHSINQDLSLTGGVSVNIGDTVTLMEGDWEILINKALNTPTAALQDHNIAEEEVVFGVYFYCAGAMAALPDDEVPKIPPLVNTALGGAPFIGSFTWGEQGPIEGYGNVHSNVANSIVVFTEDEQE
jgi:hypothetical protein